MIEQFRSILGRPVTAEQAKELYLAAKNWHPVTELEKVVQKKIIKLYLSTRSYGVVIPRVNKRLLQQLIDYEPVFLNGVFDYDPNLPVSVGLNRPSSAVYEEVNKQILKELKNAGSYKKPWQYRIKGYKYAYSYRTGLKYEGILNQKLLGGASYFIPRLLKNPFYITPKELEKAGGMPKKGARLHSVVYSNYAYFYDENGLKFTTPDRDTMRQWLEAHFDQLDKNISSENLSREEIIKYYLRKTRRFFVKSYPVYNGADVYGVKFDFSNVEGYFDNQEVDYKSNKKIPAAEKIISAYPAPKPPIKHKKGDTAAYYPAKDEIVMPLISQFVGSPQYYATLFHELIHSTGHPSRLNRKLSTDMASIDYAQEELVAEMGASYLSSMAGFLNDHIKNTAAYIKGWASRITKAIKEDDKLFIRSAGLASKAVEYITENLPKDFKEPEHKPKKETRERKQKPEPEPKPAPKKTAAKASKTNGQRKKRQPVKKTISNELKQKDVAVLLRQFYRKLSGLVYERFVLVSKNGITATDMNNWLIWKPKNIELPQNPVLIHTQDLINALKLKTGISRIDNNGNIHLGAKVIIPEVEKNVSDFPKIPAFVGKPKLGVFSGKELNYLFDKISLGKNGINQALQGVYFDTKHQKIVATEGHILIYDDAKINKSAEAINTIKVKLPNVDLMVSLWHEKNAKNKRGIKYSVGELVIYSPENEHRFPNYQAVIPGNHRKYFKVDAEELRSKVKEILQFADENVLKFSLKKTLTIAAIENGKEIASERVKIINKSKDTLNWGFNGSWLLKLVEFISRFKREKYITIYYDTNTRAFVLNDMALIMPIMLDGLNGPQLWDAAKIEKPIPETTGSIKPISDLIGRKHQSYNLGRDPLGKFLGDIEVKQSGSIVATLDAPHGAGKTRFLFQVADMFAHHGYKVLFFSLEEHPESKLFSKKVKQYISRKSKNNIFVASEISKSELDRLIPDFDVILIDSWNKLEKEIRDKENTALDLDYDLRKKFDGKFFLVVYQRTTTSTMRGGSRAQYDGDIILKIEKFPDFSKNYVYYDKNRYMIDDYVWNVYLGDIFKREDYDLLLKYE